MEKDKIHYVLDTKPPYKMVAHYKGRTESQFLELIPKVMESKNVLLFEEKVKLAEDYFKNLLT